MSGGKNRNGESHSGLQRRDFLKVVGAGSAGAAAMGCTTEKVERLIPYVTPPEEITPGVATWYASTCGECASGCGIRVRTREGRAVMIEGNPDHPVSRGGVCARGVSGLQGLYNPDRLASPMVATPNGFQAIDWNSTFELLGERLGEGGRSLLLTGAKGPTESELFNRFATALGGERVVYDPLDDQALRAASNLAFGVNAIPRYDIAAASLLVSFGADFLDTWLSHVQFAADFADMHGFDHGEKGRLIFVGPRLSLTGQNADEWIPARAGSEARVALAVAAELVRRGADAGPFADLLANASLERSAVVAGLEPEVLMGLADRFAEGGGLALGPGLAGQHSNATAANLAVLILNTVAGNVGQTLHIPDAPDSEASSFAELERAITEMRAGNYAVAIVSGTNPAYALPPAAGFAEAFAEVPFKVAFASAPDETTALADLVLPDAHPLESWGDSRPAPGVYAVRQPVMRPMPFFDSRPVADVLLELGRRLSFDLGGAGSQNFRDYLRAENSTSDDSWRNLLRRGSLRYADASSGGASAAAEPATAATVQADTFAAPEELNFGTPSLAGDGDLTLLVYPSSRFGDGTHSNRPWLQELPDSVSKIMWHSWVELNPATTARLGLRDGDVVQVASGENTVELPVWSYPGIREDVVAIAMGGGHENYGRFANGNGINAITLLPTITDAVSGAPALVSTRVSVTTTGAWRRLATTEGSNDQDNRNVTPAIALSALGHAGDTTDVEHEATAHHGPRRELQEGGGFVPVPTEGRAEDFPLPGSDFGEYGEDHPRWAMSIDLDKCTGCSACVTACQAENNIPWVEENQVAMGRDMHWLRLERYYESVDAFHAGTVDVRFLPMLCQHCNNAPCEPVCPVFAAYHTPDGLNAQAYNRCVGTRYCANNCPYKVRVFNWYSYTDDIPEPMNWQFNPDVTVRDNGVMEKCSFCVQRIRDAGNRAAVEGREVRDGEVNPACKSVCPTGAITFGNIKDGESQVAAAAADERAYRVLDEFINTQPAVHYLKKVTFHEVEEGGH